MQVYLRKPTKDEYWYEKKLLEDSLTMSYNAGWDIVVDGYDYNTGCIFKTDEKMSDLFLKRATSNKYFAYVVRKDNEQFVGYVNFQFNEDKEKWECGIVIEHVHTNNGYGKQALIQLCKIAFNEYKTDIIYNSFENSRSNAFALFKSVGFKKIFEYDGKKFNKSVKLVEIALTKDDFNYLQNRKEIMYMEGKDIILRKWQLEDVNDLFDYAKNPNIGPNAGWKPHENIEETKDVLNMLMSTDEEFAIVYKDNNKVIGGIKMSKTRFRYGVNAFELGYVLSENYQKKGLVNQASKLLIKHAFENMNAEIVEIFHYPHNLKSKRTIELLGFKYEGLLKNFSRNRLGVLHDAMCYSLTKEDYEQLKKDINK